MLRQVAKPGDKGGSGHRIDRFTFVEVNPLRDDGVARPGARVVVYWPDPRAPPYTTGPYPATVLDFTDGHYRECLNFSPTTVGRSK